MRLRFVEEPEPRGTAGALKYAEEFLDERFLMLNGDVLSDLDLSAQVAGHERTGARATLALVGVPDPSAYGLVRTGEDGSVTEFVEKPSADQVDTNLISAGAYVLERDVVEMIEPGRAVSIEREIWPRLVGNGLYACAHDAYWLDIGTPETYLQATFDILEGNVETAVADRLGGDFVATDSAGVAGRVVPPAVIERDCEIAAGAHVGALAVLGDGVRVGAGSRIERAVVLQGAEVGAGCELRTASSPRAPASATTHDQRRSRAGRGRHGRCRQRVEPGHPRVPGHRVGGGGDQVLMDGSVAQGNRLNREGIAEVDTADLLEDILAIPEHLRDALWKVESAHLEPWDSRGRADRRRHGRLRDRRRARARCAGRHRLAPDPRHARLRAAAVDDPGHDRALRELLGRHRGDAGRLRGRRRARRTARRRDNGRAPGQAGARRQACRSSPWPAASSPAPPWRTCSSPRSRSPRSAVPRRGSTRRSTSLPSTSRAASSSGGPAPRPTASPSGSRWAVFGSVPVIAGAGLTEPIAYRWKTQINENAQASRLLARAAGARPQRDRAAGTAPRTSAASRRCSSRTPTCTPACGERIELTEALIAERAHATFRVSTVGRASVERVLSLVLLGDLVSLYLAVLRGVDPTPVEVIDRLKAQLAGRR